MSYEDVFAARGAAYDDAMRRWPDARREEFTLAVACAAPRRGETLADIPAGGGYLRRYLPEGVVYAPCEPCASFNAHGASDSGGLLPLPFANGSIDVAVSIAGVHHLPARRPLYAELHRVLRAHGRLLLADVHRDAAVARFLDGFVGAHNSTGHQGRYLDQSTPRALAEAGFAIERAERMAYAWRFADRARMGEFCRALFDIRTLDAAAVTQAITQQLGVREVAGGVAMNWELYFISAHRA